MDNNKQGFTLIELLVVIAIIGLLAGISIVSLSSARRKARDVRRVADMKQVQTALAMYFDSAGQYPSSLTAGSSSIAVNGVTYLAKMPANPTPADDGGCNPSTEYTYHSASPYSTYTITWCVGAATGGVAAGNHTSTPNNIADDGNR